MSRFRKAVDQLRTPLPRVGSLSQLVGSTCGAIGPDASLKIERIVSKWTQARSYLMRRIIYTSRSRTRDDLAELDAIMEVSIARNIEAGITGMLWSDGANFAQVIEGGHDQVGATMSRIRSDPRRKHPGKAALRCFL
jgi:hypothetical protein